MKKRNILIIASVILLVLVLAVVKTCGKKDSPFTLDTAAVKRGSVNNEVTATGTIEAIKTVQVGTRVSGEINKIYVDYNSEVKAGQLLAELDRKPLTTALTISEASLENATSEMTYQTSNYSRIKALFDKKMVAESDYDLALYSYQKAQTSLKTAQLNYNKAKIDLEYAFIYSPINGVILSRSVDEGQTVAASFSTPTLFTIANDLTRMQVEASIDEADIGKVQNNQRVEFTVDAYPNQKFEGRITQIRLEPVVTSNVVTYTVIVEAPNPDKKLMPGMTANISIFVEEANNVLLVPSKSLRFSPNPSLIEAYYNSLSENKNPEFNPSGMPAPPIIGTSSGKYSMDTNPGNRIKMIWIKKGNAIQPVPVVTGIDNDIEIEIKSGLIEGDTVITAINTGNSGVTAANQQAASSPFMPKPPTRNTKKN